MLNQPIGGDLMDGCDGFRLRDGSLLADRLTTRIRLYDIFNANGVIIRRTSGSTPRHALADVLGGGGTPRAVKRNRQSIIAAAIEYPELGTATYRGLVAVPVDNPVTPEGF